MVKVGIILTSYKYIIAVGNISSCVVDIAHVCSCLRLLWRIQGQGLIIIRNLPCKALLRKILEQLRQLIELLLLLLGLYSFTLNIFIFFFRERSGSVVECLTRDQGVAGSSLSGVTALWSLSKTHLSCDMRFPTIWYVRPAKAQTSLGIHAV